MSNSMSQLLARMRQGSVTLGWGAVAAYSRSRLNRLLEQQYLARLQDNSYLPPFSATLGTGAVGDSLSVQRLAFGAPLLSFGESSMSNSKATLTLSIVGGAITTLGSLISNTVLTEALGLWVELEVDLETVIGEVDPYGRVTLNLAKGARLRSNLFEHDASLNQQVTEALQDWMQRLPARYAMFELGTVDFSGYDPLAPTRFIIRTQAAPGARVRGALTHGDGAVLVFIQLRANTRQGALPDENFPYLIPDGDYSATLVLNQSLIGHASEQGLELLARLLFPELNAFVKKEDHTPMDRALFGNIDPQRTHLTLEPALGAVIVAGEQLQFTLRDGNGQALAAHRWQVINPQSHDDAGHGRIDGNGLYQAPAPLSLGSELVPIIVTAERDEGGRTYRAAARLLVSLERMLITPVAGAYRPQELRLDVWNAGPAGVDFELLSPRQGELASLGEQGVRFMPDALARRRLLAVQQVQASAEQQRNAALIMVNAKPLVPLQPALVPGLAAGSTVQFRDVNRILPGLPRRWRILAGTGGVSPSGLFQAASDSQVQGNVVACEVLHNGVVFASGYSVVKQTRLAEVSSWKSLNAFTLTVGKNLDGVRGIVGSSGYQQLELEVTVETQAVDGKDFKLSMDEIASLALFDRSGQIVTTLADSEEGISEGEGDVWRISRVENRFVLANQSDPVAGAQPSPQGVEERTIRQTFYLHRRGASGSQVFYAGFQKDNGEWFYSNDTSHRNATIEVQVRTPEPFKASDYTFTRVRVAGGGGDSGGADPEHADFDMHLVTDDYWKLDYRAGTFYTAEFVEARDGDGQVNTSVVRWESPHGNEIYHSYTGYIFQEHGQPEPNKVSFDTGMEKLLGRNDFERSVASQYEAGLLVIANFRNDNRLLRDARDLPEYTKMTKPLRIRLRDSRANEHLIQIDYLPADTVGDRNVLVHSVPSRPRSQGAIIRLRDRSEGVES